jgi:hypothetical protein
VPVQAVQILAGQQLQMVFQAVRVAALIDRKRERGTEVRAALADGGAPLLRGIMRRRAVFPAVTATCAGIAGLGRDQRGVS